MDRILKAIRALPEQRRGLLWVICFSTVLRGLLLLFLSDTVINNDGVLYISAAQQFSEGNIKEALGLYPMPLYPLLIAVVHSFVSHWVTAARVISLISLVLLLIPLYWLTEDLFNRRAAFWGCLALALAPLPMRLTTFVVREPVFVLLFTSGVYFAQRTLQSKRVVHLLMTAFLAWLATLLRLEAIIIFPVFLFIVLGLAFVRPEVRKEYAVVATIWLTLPVCVIMVALWTGGPDGLAFNRYGEFTRGLQDLFQLRFLDNYRSISAQLTLMEDASLYSVGSQNFAEIARHFIAVIYLLGLLQSLIEVIFLVNIIPLWLSVRRHQWQKTHFFVFILATFYLIVMYYFLIQRDFLEKRFLLAPAVILYPWIGMGIDRILSATQNVSRRVLIRTVSAILLLVAPVSVYGHVFKKSDNVAVQAGEWLARQQDLRAAKIVTTDRRILFYAGREVFPSVSNSHICYRDKMDQSYAAIERVAKENHMDLIIIETSTPREELLPRLSSYREIGRFVGEKRMVIVYSRIQ